jgi:DUF177 domain-containing protein
MPRHPVIDALEVAQAGASLRGEFAAADFVRLRDKLAAGSGGVEYQLQGCHDAQGRPALRLRVRGSLQLVCQRCLGAVEQPVDIDSQLVLAASQAEVDREPLAPEGPDRIVASRGMPVRELIEDELLLAVPYAPRHAQCTFQGAAGSDSTRSPFAGLGALLGDRDAGRRKRGGQH